MAHPPGTAWVFRNSACVRELLLLLTITGCLFFIGLGRLPLLEPDEGRNAEVAREMLADGSWITPHFDTLPYLDKPAIFFWMVAGSMRLFGLSEQAARLPSALMALGAALLVWLLARRMFPEVSVQTGGSGNRSSGSPNALLAAIVWATCPLVIAFAREVILDMTLTFLLTTALVSFWFASSQSPGGAGLRRLWANVILFGSMGLATFVKGPVGFVLPLLVIIVYQWSRGRIAELGQPRWGLGIVSSCWSWRHGLSRSRSGTPRFRATLFGMKLLSGLRPAICTALVALSITSRYSSAAFSLGAFACSLQPGIG